MLLVADAKIIASLPDGSPGDSGWVRNHGMASVQTVPIEHSAQGVSAFGGAASNMVECASDLQIKAWWHASDRIWCSRIYLLHRLKLGVPSTHHVCPICSQL